MLSTEYSSRHPWEDPIDKSSVDVVTKKGDHKTVVVKIPKAGTYYIGIYTMVNAKDKSEYWKFIDRSNLLEWQ